MDDPSSVWVAIATAVTAVCGFLGVIANAVLKSRSEAQETKDEVIARLTALETTMNRHLWWHNERKRR